MTMQEIVTQISFLLGFPANQNVEELQPEQAVNIAFTELKRYMNTPVDKTVPYSTRLDLVALGIKTEKVLYVQAAVPKIGVNMGSIESGNVFQIAASTNAYSNFAASKLLNLDPIMIELGYSQVQNSLTTDFQWKHDPHNKVVYCTHRSLRPAYVTIRYVPEYSDVSEITNHTWINYLLRLSEAYMKKALGRTRSKYRLEGSNVTLDGEALLAEANAELEQIHNELGTKSSKLVILN